MTDEFKPPEPNPFESPKLKAATDLLVKSLVNARTAWMDSVMSRLLPTDIYALSRSGKGSDRMKLARWMAKNDLKLMDGDGYSHILVGQVLISEWRWRMENNKVEQTYRTSPDHELEAMRDILSMDLKVQLGG